MARNVLQSSLLNAGFSIIFQILCRILTFAINAFIVRNVGREVLGIMNVRLLLLESTLLFLSREAINRAALSANSQERDKCSWAQLINQMWLTVPICVVLCVPCLYIWQYWLSTVDAPYVSQYQFACYAVALSCVLELCAEAPVFVGQVFCFVKLKIILNTLHILVRSVIFLWIVFDDRSAAITAFAIAQLASAVTIVVGQYLFFLLYIKRFNTYRTNILSKTKEKQKQKQTQTQTQTQTKQQDNKHQQDHHQQQQQQQHQLKLDTELFDQMEDFPFYSLSEMLPGIMTNKLNFFNKELQILTVSFIKQGVLKQILTEGEKYVMSMSPVLSFSEQATYDVVNNLGSLAARFIFRPIEDSSYFYFTQTISRDIKLAKQDKINVNQANSVLHNLLLAVSSIGLLAFTFGQSYSYTLLLFYGGADFVEGGLPQSLLQWHCLAICFLAVNGITEGYMFATNTSRDIDKYNYLMAIFSVSFLVLSYILTSIFGPVGFIFANCINMFCRVCYSTNFIRKRHKAVELKPLLGLVPGKFFASTLVIVGLACKYSMYYNNSQLKHLAFGLACGIVCLLVWAIENRQLVRVAWKYARRIKIE